MVVFSAEWFEKHQRILLWLLNAPLIGWWFRWVLCIRRGDVGYRQKIVRIAPHYYTVGNANGSLTTDFRTHAKYSKRLYWAFLPIWRTLHWWDETVANPLIPALNAGFDTLTAYPDPSTGATTVDGIVGRNDVSEAWSTIRSGAGTSAGAGDVTNYAFFIQAAATSGQWQHLRRGVYLFDTSAIGVSGSITAATLSLYGVAKSDDLGITPSCDIYTTTPAANNNLAAADFGQFGTTSQTTGAIAYGSLSASAYNDWTLSATGRGNISQTGVSRFGTRNGNYDADNVAPTWSDSLQSWFEVYQADQTGTTNDPKLVVTYFGVSASPSISPSASKSPSASFSPSASVSASISPSASSNQFLYPNADIAAGGWTPTSGANLYQMLDETLVPDDSSTYIYSPISDGTCVVELREGSTLIATRTIARPSTVDQWQTFVYELTTGEKNAVSDWTNLAFWFTVNGSDVAKVKLQSGSVPGTLADPVIMYVRMRIKLTAP